MLGFGLELRVIGKALLIIEVVHAATGPKAILFFQSNCGIFPAILASAKRMTHRYLTFFKLILRAACIIICWTLHLAHSYLAVCIESRVYELSLVLALPTTTKRKQDE